MILKNEELEEYLFFLEEEITHPGMSVDFPGLETEQMIPGTALLED